MDTTRIHEDRKGTEGETRAMRGLRLHRERGSEIVTYLDGSMGVPSRTDEGVIYHVDLDAETCECPDATCRTVSCLHMVAAEAKRREVAREAAPKPPARKRGSAPPMAVRGQMARDFMSRMGTA